MMKHKGEESILIREVEEFEIQRFDWKVEEFEKRRFGWKVEEFKIRRFEDIEGPITPGTGETDRRSRIMSLRIRRVRLLYSISGSIYKSIERAKNFATRRGTISQIYCKAPEKVKLLTSLRDENMNLAQTSSKNHGSRVFSMKGDLYSEI